MKNTTWLLLIAVVLVFTMVCWTNYLQGHLEKVLQKLQTTEWIVNELQKVNIRDQETIKHFEQQYEQLKKK